MKHFSVPRLKAVCLKIGRKSARIIARTSLPETAFVTSFILGRYLLNADFQYPSEIIIPILYFALLATIFLYMYRLVLRSWIGARIASLLLLAGLYNYDFLPDWLHDIGKFFLPKSLETSFGTATTSAVVMAVAFGVVGYGIKLLIKRVAFVRNLQPHRVVLFALLFIFAVQVYKTISRLIIIHKELAYAYPSPNFSRTPDATVQKPDIYYFVFDRYGNAQTLQNVYGYDESGLLNTLAGQGFVTRTNATSNYPFTMQSISSTLAMQYHTALGKEFGNDRYQAAFAYRSILNNPPVAQVLKQNGYRYNQVSSWWDFTRVNIEADEHPTQSFRLRAFGKNFYLSDLTRDIVNKSIMSPWLKKGLTVGKTTIVKYDLDYNPRQNFFAQVDALKDLADTPHAQPQFTFAHFLSPHDPYIFSADGSDPSYDGGRNDWGVDEKVKYVNAITYLNTQIEDVMGYIRKNSPNAVIIIQADEGPYPKAFRFKLSPDHFYNPKDLSLADEQQKFGILASYYMPGVDADTVKQNITASVNPFRFVLQHYLGYNLDMLPNCQFATANKYQIYDFTNETTKLQGASAPAACSSL